MGEIILSGTCPVSPSYGLTPDLLVFTVVLHAETEHIIMVTAQRICSQAGYVETVKKASAEENIVFGGLRTSPADTVLKDNDI